MPQQRGIWTTCPPGSRVIIDVMSAEKSAGPIIQIIVAAIFRSYWANVAGMLLFHSALHGQGTIALSARIVGSLLVGDVCYGGKRTVLSLRGASRKARGKHDWAANILGRLLSCLHGTRRA